MESKLKDNNFEIKPKGSGVLEYLMFLLGIMQIAGSMIWVLAKWGESDYETWYSRFALGVICIGFAGVIREVRKLREKND